MKVVVIGAGVFGGYHATKFKNNNRCELIGIFDRDLDRAKIVAQNFGVKAFDHISDFIDNVDAVSIASPGSTHFAYAKRCMSSNVHCLVEKPLALLTGEALELVALSKTSRRVLAIGHQERALIEAIGLKDISEIPLSISANRSGQWTGRSSDISVVMDLMVHDIDFCNFLFNSDVASVSSKGKVFYTQFLNRVKCELTFLNGSTADLYGSRMENGSKRLLTLNYDSGKIEIDFINKRIINQSKYRLACFGDFDRIDPLQVNIDRFVSACLDEKISPLADGIAGMNAIKVAECIEKATQTDSE